MFTGLVSELGEAVSLRRHGGGGGVLAVRAAGAAREAAPGDSIAVNGACLTVTGLRGAELSFDLSSETLRSTTLGTLKPGEKVDIEQSLRADGKLGGHFVTGHVDAVGRIKSRAAEGETLRFEISAPPEVMELLVEKGSVAVDGISLTVVDVLGESFTLVIVPHTAGLTTLGFKGAGDMVNLETDIIGKYVHRFLKGRAGGDDKLMETLMREGFLGK
jgi:riboflavin synthase